MTRLSLLFLALTLAAACSSKAQRARASKHVNPAYLAPIAAKDRAALHEGRVRAFLAEWQLRHSEGKLRDAESQTAIAKNDVKQAKLALDSARVLLKGANEGADTNKIAEAQKAEAIAVSELELAKAKLERSKVHRNYLKARVEHEHAENELAIAEIEVGRADAMKAAGIEVSGVDTKTFANQRSAMANAAKGTRSTLDAKTKELQGVDKSVAALQAKVDALRGKPVTAPTEATGAPMAPLDPVEETPSEESPSEETPTEEPAAETPSEEPPAEEAPAEEAPTEEPAAEEPATPDEAAAASEGGER